MNTALQQEIVRNVAAALREDVGSGDVTAQLLPASAGGEARVISREHALLCGRGWFDEVFRALDSGVHIEWESEDGETIEPDQIVCRLRGPARALLTGERTALNFLQTLSGTATAARQYTQAIAGTSAVILDTRKTLPGLRVAQKYATRCGGCKNHRMGLYDGILIKENHILAAGGIAAAVAGARRASSQLPVEVEVENMDEVEQALNAEADIILLDNFENDMLRQAVDRNQGQARLEASGGVNLDTIAGIAATGVDFISVGAITKDVRATDLSMRLQLE